MEEPTQPPADSITEEFSRLGRTLGQALKLAWESGERKRLEQDIAEGMRRLSEQIDTATRSAAESPTAKEVTTKVTTAWETAHGPQILDEIRAGLVESLRKLNEELDRRVQKAQASTAPPEVEEAR
jgi:hypothetical protein